MEKYPEISGFILAGGKSRRMGTDKALMMINDLPLLVRVKNLIEPFCKSVAIGGYRCEYEQYNIEMVPDVFPDCGPISGIYSCLIHSNSEWNLLVSVDTPFIQSELINFLISQTGDFDCVIPKHSDGIEPSVALYNRKIASTIEESIKNRDFKLQNLVSILNANFPDCNSLIKKYPRLFFNINCPEDFNRI